MGQKKFLRITLALLSDVEVLLKKIGERIRRAENELFLTFKRDGYQVSKQC